MFSREKLLLASFGLCANLCLADALNVGDIKIEMSSTEVPNGIIWQSSHHFAGTVDFSNVLAYVKEVSLVLTPEGGSGDLDHKKFLDLPIEIAETNGLKIGFLGEIKGNWGDASLYWSANNFFDIKTEVVTTGTLSSRTYNALDTAKSSSYSKSGGVTYSLSPILYCDSPSGKCKIPSSISIDSLYLRLYSFTYSFKTSEPIIKGGTIKIQSGCTFDIKNTVFSGIKVANQSYGTMLAGQNGEFETTFAAHCSYRDTAGSLKIRLTPVGGYLSDNKSVGKTTLDGLGLVYRLNSPPTSVFNFGNWNTDVSHNITKDSGEVWSSGSIFWGLYQYQDKLSPGPFTGTVNYEFWID